MKSHKIIIERERSDDILNIKLCFKTIIYFIYIIGSEKILKIYYICICYRSRRSIMITTNIFTHNNELGTLTAANLSAKFCVSTNIYNSLDRLPMPICNDSGYIDHIYYVPALLRSGLRGNILYGV